MSGKFFLLIVLSSVHALPQSASTVGNPTITTSAAPQSTEAAVQLAKGLSDADITDAYPARDPAQVQNWYGTSLFGWNGCTEKQKGNIKEAYKDAHKLVSYDEIKEDIDFNTAAALEFLGPTALNKNQQSQIQAVFANVATVYTGATWYTPNWIRVRCDDPRKRCTQECPPPSSMEEEDTDILMAYARNPFNQGNDRFSDVNFCPDFFILRKNLGNAMKFGSTPSNPRFKSNLKNYMGRADTLLHELLHLDLAANSKNNNPNPQIRDLKIKYSEHKSDQKDIKHSWTKVYGPRLAKILARFQPIRTDQSLGYWIQRSDDSYTMFALASYVQQKFGYYPYIPLVYDQITDMPMLPLPRDGTGAGSLTNYDFVGYNASSAGDVVFVNITQGDKGECPTVYENGSDEDVEIGAAIPDSLYPSAYWDQYNKWIEEIKDLAGEPTSGTCKFNIEEIWTSEPADSNLYANIDLYDFSGTLIYSTPQSTSSPGVPIDDANPYHLMEEGMKEALIIVGEHANDYIQFTYGDQFWQSSDTEGTPSCTLIGNNWEQPTSDESSTRNFECHYLC